MAQAPADSGRLPSHVRPTRYDLFIAPDLESSTFSGDVTMELAITAATDQIVLNARDLAVDVVSLVQGDDRIAARLTPAPGDERIVVTAERALDTGEATLALHFDGRISDGLLGFYRSTYTDGDGTQQVLAATQFEATHARAAFPCFDEPEFKAVFAVTLDVAADLLAVSNGPEVARDKLPDGRVRVSYGETIPMSTYLVAWVVGPLVVTDPVDASGVAVRVVHVPGRESLTQFALDVGSFAIQFFTEYYGIPYPGQKCDLVALPDFSFGAMENLGCVTFRETRLLLDPDDVTLDEMAGAALTIVHEIAHMWFGDLVTMKWWNGIWLNEAFATFMEHLGTDAYRPEWKTWDDFATGRAAALEIDALDATRTVEYEVVSPADAEGMFDILTYQKGGSVLRMLERWLGADSFRSGVRLYLDRYRFANTETTDLWDALEEATGQPVRRMMDTWIFQPGFPMVEAAADQLSQRRFALGNAVEGRWVVPVLARAVDVDQNATSTTLLESTTAKFEALDATLEVLNAGGEGFYRVAYPASWRDRLLDSGALTPLERFALLDDLWSFVLAGRESAATFLACARRFAAEHELVVWRVLGGHLRAAGRLVEGDALERYRSDVAAIVRPSMQRLGWETGSGDDARTRQLRGLLVSLLGAFVRDPETVARAREVEARGGGDADVEAACVSVVASAGHADDFDHFLDRVGRASSPQEELRYLYALGDFPDEALVLRAADLALTDAVRAQNGPFVLQRALRNRDHGPAAWAFVRDNWERLGARFSPNLVPRILDGTTWLVEGSIASDVTEFVAEHPLPSGGRTVAQLMERLQVHRSAVERERVPFSDSLLGRTEP